MKTATAQTAHSRKFYVIEIALMVGLALFLLTGGLALQTQDQLAEKVVRLHILANSVRRRTRPSSSRSGMWCWNGPRRS